MIAFMRSAGNERARNQFEARAPVFYVRPKEYDLAMVRERWIRAKYEKKLFVKAPTTDEDENVGSMPTVHENGSAAAASNAAAASDAAAASPVPAAATAAPSPSSASSVSAASASLSRISLSANRPGASNGAANGNGSLPHRASTALSSLASAAPTEDPALFYAPERPTEGWLYKENKKAKWQKRWFTLWGRELHYFKDAGDSYEKGRIDVAHCKILIPDCSGTGAQGSAMASTSSGAPAGHRYLFELVSTEQDRAYPLAAESEEEMFGWIHAIRRAMIFYTVIARGEEAAGMIAQVADVKTPFARLPAVAKKGFLSKQGGGWTSWNKRFFVLSKENLYYYKQQPADVDVSGGMSSARAAPATAAAAAAAAGDERPVCPARGAAQQGRSAVRFAGSCAHCSPTLVSPLLFLVHFIAILPLLSSSPRAASC